MSKVYNKVVQSNTEPSKNDIWLKDGQMKTFGKEGWKPIGGGSSLDANTPIKESVDGTELVPIFDGENKAVSITELIKGGKELYYIDFEYYQTNFDHDKLEELNNLAKRDDILIVTKVQNQLVIAIPSPDNGNSNVNRVVSFSMMIGGNTYNSTTSNLEPKIRLLTFYFYYEYGIGYYTGESDKEIVHHITGDGTKFLSDDGTYKEISSVFRFINYADWVYQGAFNSNRFNTWYQYNRELLLNIEKDKIVKVNINGECYTINSVTHTIDNLVGEEYITLYCDYGERTIALSKIDGTWTFNTGTSTSGIALKNKITTLETKITALEERIAALEGATA